MEVTINYNGQAVAVRGHTWKSMNFLTGPTTKPRTCPHEQRRHWDGREFDEYIVATEGVGIYGETPEEYLCRMETLGELIGRPGHLHRGPAPPGSCSMPLDGLTLAEIGGGVRLLQSGRVSECGGSQKKIYKFL